MPRLIGKSLAYCRHKVTRQAIVTLAGQDSLTIVQLLNAFLRGPIHGVGPSRNGLPARYSAKRAS